MGEQEYANEDHEADLPPRQEGPTRRGLQEKVARLEGELADAKGLPTDSEICQSCGSAVTLVWHARDEDWEKVIGSPGGLRCARCFAAEAWEKGINLAFLAVPLEEGWTKPQAKTARLEERNAAMAAALDYLKLFRASLHGLSGRQQVDAVLVQESLDHGLGLAALSGEEKVWAQDFCCSETHHYQHHLGYRDGSQGDCPYCKPAAMKGE